jgi:hypothetical protein
MQEENKEIVLDVVLASGIEIGFILEDEFFFVHTPRLKNEEYSVAHLETKFRAELKHSDEDREFYSLFREPVLFGCFRLGSFDCFHPICQISDERIRFLDIRIERRYGATSEMVQDLNNCRGSRSRSRVCLFHSLLVIWLEKLFDRTLVKLFSSLPLEVTAVESHGRIMGLIHPEKTTMFTPLINYGSSLLQEGPVVASWIYANELVEEFDFDQLLSAEEQETLPGRSHIIAVQTTGLILVKINKAARKIIFPRFKKYQIRTKLNNMDGIPHLVLNNTGELFPATQLLKDEAWLVRGLVAIESSERQIMKERITTKLWWADGVVWRLFGREDELGFLSEVFSYPKKTPDDFYNQNPHALVTDKAWIKKFIPDDPSYMPAKLSTSICLLPRRFFHVVLQGIYVKDVRLHIMSFLSDGFIEDLRDRGGKLSRKLKEIYKHDFVAEKKNEDENPLRTFVSKEAAALVRPIF